MTTRTRWIVLLVSTPVVAFVVIGSLLGRTLASQGAYEHLRVFEDVVSLVTQNYVEPVNVDKVMSGAMRGLADGLDADSAYLTPEQVRTFEAERVAAAGTTGLELTRGYYLRVVSARDGSPAARAGLRTGDYVRAINGAPTRNMSALEGMRLLRGAVGSKVTLTVLRGSATDPRDIPLVREAPPATDVTSRVQTPGVGYVRVAAFTTGAAGRLEQAVTQLARGGATSVIVDLRDTAEGRLEEGIAAARPFVPAGKTLSTPGNQGAARRRPSPRRPATARSPRRSCCSRPTARPAPPNCSRRRCSTTSARRWSASTRWAAPACRSW